MIPRIFVTNAEYEKYFEEKYNPPSIISKADSEKFDLEFDTIHTALLELLDPHARFFNDTDLETADFDVNWDHNHSRWFNVRLFSPKLFETTKLLNILTEFAQSLPEDYAIWVDCDYCNVDDDDEDAPLIEAIILRDRIIAEPCPEEFALEYINSYGFSRGSFVAANKR